MENPWTESPGALPEPGPILGTLWKSRAGWKSTFPGASPGRVNSLGPGLSWSKATSGVLTHRWGKPCPPGAAGGCEQTLDSSACWVGQLLLRFWKMGIGSDKFQSQTISPGKTLERRYFSKGSASYTHQNARRSHQREKKASWPVGAPSWNLEPSPSVAVFLERAVFLQKHFFWKILRCPHLCFSLPPLKHTLLPA